MSITTPALVLDGQALEDVKTVVNDRITFLCWSIFGGENVLDPGDVADVTALLRLSLGEPGFPATPWRTYTLDAAEVDAVREAAIQQLDWNELSARDHAEEPDDAAYNEAARVWYEERAAAARRALALIEGHVA